ncbi:cell division protein ZapA [Fulvivirgaceae bacterium BMA10]|uniref:Cell division protein ZapA n=1 Tax=Splendidivirga corallicola TaxID=3051826 RepID=A0ABT8KJA5_9BACT|nr:cell division protein ZapA [Fulvivirgaceae bacterium BMA10]
MEELSIKIKIGDREYPMKVNAGDEERIRKAGKAINEKIKAYRNQFGIDDKQDLLAMVAFDCLIDKMRMEEEHFNIDENLATKIKSLSDLIS